VPSSTSLLVINAQCWIALQLLHDELVQASLGVGCGNRQSILDGHISTATVANDANAVDTQKGCAPMRAIVVAIDDIGEGLLSHAALLGQLAQYVFGNCLHREIKDPFAHLEDNVAHESIRHDYVASALINIAAFDIADELLAQRTGIEQGMGF